VLELRSWLAGQRETVRQWEKAQLLERVWSEQFEVAEGGGVVRKTQIPATPVQDPHEPEAHAGLDHGHRHPAGHRQRRSRRGRQWVLTYRLRPLHRPLRRQRSSAYDQG
jgi:hypothetical protein